MHIQSATFIKGVVGPDEVLENSRPQVAFVGRSNVGKSSTINALVGADGLAHTSSKPGRTTELNVYLINGSFYLLDLPGIGYASMSKRDGLKLRQLIDWYLFESPYTPRNVVLIIDANVGATKADLELLLALERRRHAIIVVANKVDALKPSAQQRALRDLQLQVGEHPIIPFSAKKSIGVSTLRNALLG